MDQLTQHAIIDTPGFVLFSTTFVLASTRADVERLHRPHHERLEMFPEHGRSAHTLGA